MDGLELKESGTYIGFKRRPAMSSLSVVVVVKDVSPYPQIRVINTENLQDVDYNEWYKIEITKKLQPNDFHPASITI